MIQATVTTAPYLVTRRTVNNDYDLIARKTQMDNILLIPGLDRPNPNNLFRDGQVGGWLDPYDLTKMWVDNAGTTPMTASDLGVGIGRIQTKGGPVITFEQATSGDRPVWGRHPVSGIRNLLTNTDTLSTQSVTVAAVQKTLSFRGTGTVTLSGASTAGPLIGTGASNVVSLTFTPSAGSLTLTVSGTVEVAQLEAGSSRTTYQKVTNRFDITETGQPDLYYFSGNGVNQRWRSAANLDLSGVNVLTVWAGVRTNQGSTRAAIYSHNTDATNFSQLEAPGFTSNNYEFSVRTGLTCPIADSPYTAPTTDALVGVHNRDARQLWRNGSLVDTGTGDSGANNLPNAPLDIFYRGSGPDRFFNGNMYSFIIAGDNYDTRTIQQFSDWSLKPRRLITA